MTQILQDILKLSVPERILLAESIWNSIAENEENMELTEETKQLLDQRLEAHIKNPNEGSDWSEVYTRLKNQL
ncbi:MAG: addiction module protein [Bacteroidota bacterium]